jgi:hypothetical protein
MSLEARNVVRCGRARRGLPPDAAWNSEEFPPPASADVKSRQLLLTLARNYRKTKAITVRENCTSILKTVKQYKHVDDHEVDDQVAEALSGRFFYGKKSLASITLTIAPPPSRRVPG